MFQGAPTSAVALSVNVLPRTSVSVMCMEVTVTPRRTLVMSIDTTPYWTPFSST